MGRRRGVAVTGSSAPVTGTSSDGSEHGFHPVQACYSPSSSFALFFSIKSFLFHRYDLLLLLFLKGISVFSL